MNKVDAALHDVKNEMVKRYRSIEHFYMILTTKINAETYFNCIPRSSADFIW